jgi:hypothetical protein
LDGARTLFGEQAGKRGTKLPFLRTHKTILFEKYWALENDWKAAIPLCC